jgi:SAM-dependent methyltransferase
VKPALRRAIGTPFRLLPGRLRRGLARALFEGVAAQEPRTALRQLLELDDDLTFRISDVSVGYEGEVHVKHRLMRYHEFFVDRIQASDHVLDIGCGVGAVAYSIAGRTGAQVTGIDISKANIEQARRLFRLPNLAFVEGDVLRDIPTGSFEVVVLSNILEHIDQRVAFLDRLRQAVAPARWLFRVPSFDRDWRVPLRQELGLPYFSDVSHYTEYTVPTFEAEMREAGLEITHLQVNWGEIWAECRSARARPTP